MNNRIESKNPENRKVPAATRGMLGAIIGLIIMAVFLICFDVWATSNGEYVDRTRYLGMLAVAPLYGFGYAFGYKKMAGWFATSLHYSGGIMGAAFIWWVLTGSKKGFLRGFFLIMVMFGMVAAAAWVPGIPMGIHEIRKERKEKKIADAAIRQENRLQKKAEQQAAREARAEERAQSSPARSASAERKEPKPYIPPIQPPLPGSHLLCFGGEFAGGSFDLANGKELVIGRDPSRSNIVIPGSDISRAHCMVRYDAASRCGLVKDISSNGISFLDGTPVPKNQYVRVEGGNGIRIGANGPVFLFQ